MAPSRRATEGQVAALALAAVVAFTGCAPTLESLVRTNRLREVVCAGDERLPGAVGALDGKAAAQVQVVELPDAELERTRGRAWASQYRLLKLIIATSSLPLEAVTVEARLAAGPDIPAGWLARAPPAPLPSTPDDEAPLPPSAFPPPATDEHATTSTFVAGLKLLASMVVAPLALVSWDAGLLRWIWSSDSASQPLFVADGRAPTPDSTARTECGGAPCVFEFAVDRRVQAPLQLELTLVYEALRPDEPWDDGTEKTRCSVTSRHAVPLNPTVP